MDHRSAPMDITSLIFSSVADGIGGHTTVELEFQNEDAPAPSAQAPRKSPSPKRGGSPIRPMQFAPRKEPAIPSKTKLWSNDGRHAKHLIDGLLMRAVPSALQRPASPPDMANAAKCRSLIMESPVDQTWSQESVARFSEAAGKLGFEMIPPDAPTDKENVAAQSDLALVHELQKARIRLIEGPKETKTRELIEESERLLETLAANRQEALSKQRELRELQDAFATANRLLAQRAELAAVLAKVDQCVEQKEFQLPVEEVRTRGLRVARDRAKASMLELRNIAKAKETEAMHYSEDLDTVQAHMRKHSTAICQSFSQAQVLRKRKMIERRRKAHEAELTEMRQLLEQQNSKCVEMKKRLDMIHSERARRAAEREAALIVVPDAEIERLEALRVMLEDKLFARIGVTQVDEFVKAFQAQTQFKTVWDSSIKQVEEKIEQMHLQQAELTAELTELRFMGDDERNISDDRLLHMCHDMELKLEAGQRNEASAQFRYLQALETLHEYQRGLNPIFEQIQRFVGAKHGALSVLRDGSVGVGTANAPRNSLNAPMQARPHGTRKAHTLCAMNVL
jgi:hypothetical protein